MTHSFVFGGMICICQNRIILFKFYDIKFLSAEEKYFRYGSQDSHEHTHLLQWTANVSTFHLHIIHSYFMVIQKEIGGNKGHTFRNINGRRDAAS